MCFIKPYQETENFYYLLVITTDNVKMKYTMQHFVNKRLSSVFLLVHGSKEMIKAIKRQNWFFQNTLSNGALIYTTAGFAIIPEALIEQTEQMLNKDKEAFKQMHHLASGFLKTAKINKFVSLYFFCYN